MVWCGDCGKGQVARADMESAPTEMGEVGIETVSGGRCRGGGRTMFAPTERGKVKSERKTDFVSERKIKSGLTK